MQTRKNQKKKSKKWGSGPKSKKSKKSKSPPINIEEIPEEKKINIQPTTRSISPEPPNLLLSFLPNKTKEYEEKKRKHESEKEKYKKYQKLNKIYGEFYIKLNELIVLFKSVDTDYINKNKLQSIIDSYNHVKAKIVDGIKLYNGITDLENEPNIDIDSIIDDRINYIENVEGYKTKINKIIERINEAKAEEIKKEEKDAIKKRVEEEEKKQKEEEYKEKKTAKKEEKKAAKAATKIQSLFRGRTARKRYIKTMREFAKTKKQTLSNMIAKTPQEISGEEWSTFFKEDVTSIKKMIKSVKEIMEINRNNGFSEYYENIEAKKYSHVIFFILGFLTPLLEKKGVTMYLKGGQAIHLNRQSIIQKNPKLEYPDYPSNDIDIDFMIHTNSILKKIGKIDLCYMIRNFIYWCVNDDDNINIQHIQYRKNLSSIENDKTNVLKISYREFPTSGKIFALIDFSFKETPHDINKLFTTDYIESMDVNVNETTYRYKFQSLLSLILEKMFILLHENDPNIAIADKPDIIQKFKKTFDYIMKLYIAQPDKTIENISSEYQQVFNAEKENVEVFIKSIYPEKQQQTKDIKDMKENLKTTMTVCKNYIIKIGIDNKLINNTFDEFLITIPELNTYEKLCDYVIKNGPLILRSIKTVLADMRKYKSSTNSIKNKTPQIKDNLNEITGKIIMLEEVEKKLTIYFNTLCR